MNPNRVSDKKLSPAAIRVRFITMITLIVTVLLGLIGFNMHNKYKKEKAKDSSSQIETVDPETEAEKVLQERQ